MENCPLFTERRTVWFSCVLSTGAAFLLVEHVGMSVAIGSLAGMAVLVLVPLSLHCIYTWLRPEPRIAAVSGGVAALIWAGCAAMVIALAALGTDAPLIDSRLALADATLRFDAPAVIEWLSQPVLSKFLGVAYVSTVPLVFGTAIFLALMRNDKEMWQLCFTFCASAASCALISAIAPALGTFVHYKISPHAVALLPAGAGTYFLPIEHAYRSGAIRTIDLQHFQGVVTFPSFHAAMAAMSAYGVRGIRRLFLPMLGWCSLVLASTVPMGGHYGIDLVAGILVWATFRLAFTIGMNPDFRMSHLVVRRRRSSADQTFARQAIILSRRSD